MTATVQTGTAGHTWRQEEQRVVLWHQVCSGVTEHTAGTTQLPRGGCFPHPPPGKAWLLQHLPQSSVCIPSYSGRAVWELLALPECSGQQRDSFNPLSSRVKLPFVQSLPLYHGIDPQAKSVTHEEMLFHLPNNGLNI